MSSTSWADMVRSLAVVLGVVLAVVLLVPRPNEGATLVVEVAQVAARQQSEARFTLGVPTELRAGWRASSADLRRSTDDVPTWHVGMSAPSGQAVTFEQAKDVTKEWLAVQTARGAVAGEYDVDGTTWQKRSRPDRNTQSLIRVDGDVTTIVTGTTGYAELAEVAASIETNGET